MISKVMEIDPKNDNIKKIVVFDKTITETDLIKLYNDFGCDREKITKSIKICRSAGLILDLLKADKDYGSDWAQFLEKEFPRSEIISKLDNIFLSRDYNRLLLITNKRLMMTDIKRVNEKINNANSRIAEYNEDWLEKHPQKAEGRKTFGERVKGIFLK